MATPKKEQILLPLIAALMAQNNKPVMFTRLRKVGDSKKRAARKAQKKARRINRNG
jgi:hypothetical protein